MSSLNGQQQNSEFDLFTLNLCKQLLQTKSIQILKSVFLIFYRRMFKQLLQVNLKQPHDKQKYGLKRNEFVVKQESQSVKFDSICYTSEDIMSKIIYELVSMVSKHKEVEKPSITVTFNYDIKANDLILFFSKIMEVKPFNSFEFAHFEVKYRHISDYCKNAAKGGNVLIDDLDQFEKDIDNSLILDRFWKINEYLCFKPLCSSTLIHEFSGKNAKFGKKKNQLFVLEINKRIRVILILLPRTREAVFTRQQEKEIEEIYILRKHACSLAKQTICFNTYVAQIINNYLQKAQLNFLVSCYPQQDRPLTQVFRLPLRLSHPCGEEIRTILQAYNKDKWSQLEHQLQKARKRLKQTQYLVKSEQDNMKRLIKFYTKTFYSTFANIEYLKNKGITNIVEHINWLKGQIKLKEVELEAEQSALKQIHKKIIVEERQHLFYVNKIQQYKNNVENAQKQRKAIGSPASIKVKSQSFSAKDSELTEEELFYLYDPIRQANKYRQKKEQELKKRINVSNQKRQFLKMLEEAKQRLENDQYNAFQEEYYDLISQ